MQAYENPEDIRGRENVEIKKDEDVERVRRAHLNDLENIPAFLLAGFFYVLTEPNVDLALWLFRIAVLARIGHTIVSILCILKHTNYHDYVLLLIDRFMPFTQYVNQHEEFAL